MSKILYIKADPKKEGESRTIELADSFLNEYMLKNTNDTVEILDLYKEDIKFLSYDDMMSHKNPELLDKDILKYVNQFLSSDKIVIAAPFWNLSIPAILKAYIDYICITGLTFKYTANGPVGLCQDKKLVHFVTRGGDYSNDYAKDMEMGDRYLKTIFSFLGIEDYFSISADKLDVIGVDKVAVLSQAKEEAKKLAEKF